MSNLISPHPVARSQEPEPWDEAIGHRHMRGSSRWTWIEHAHLWRPPTDLFETEQAFIVRVEVAGMGQGDFTVTLQERILRVGGLRPDPDQRRAYHQMEIHYGEFRTEVELPAEVEAQQIEASYEDGFLIVLLPKAKPRLIAVVGD